LTDLRTPVLISAHDLDECRNLVLSLHGVDGVLSNVLNQATTHLTTVLKTTADPRPDQTLSRTLTDSGRAKRLN
jgi:hypothetical protein